MKKTKVDSSIVLAIGYDKAKSLLEVELLSHDVYDYLGVPEDVYRSFLTAES